MLESDILSGKTAYVNGVKIGTGTGGGGGKSPLLPKDVNFTMANYFCLHVGRSTVTHRASSHPDHSSDTVHDISGMELYFSASKCAHQ